MLPLRRWSVAHARWWGVLGPAILVAGTSAAAWGYTPVHGYGYSFLNRAISDLGDARDSPWAAFFNGGMIVGATMLAMFNYGIGQRMNTRRSPRIAAVGMLGSLGMALIGVFPSAPPTQEAHLVVAAVAFICTVALGLSFTLDMLVTPQTVLPQWLILPGALSAACSGSFLLAMLVSRAEVLPREALQFGVAGPRPLVDLVPLLEWSVLFSILLWAFLTAASFRENRADLNAEPELGPKS